MTDAELEDLSRNLVAYHNASENAGAEVFSVWDPLNPGVVSASPAGSLGLS